MTFDKSPAAAEATLAFTGTLMGKARLQRLSDQSVALRYQQGRTLATLVHTVTLLRE